MVGTGRGVLLSFCERVLDAHRVNAGAIVRPRLRCVNKGNKKEVTALRALRACIARTQPFPR